MSCRGLSGFLVGVILEILRFFGYTLILKVQKIRCVVGWLILPLIILLNCYNVMYWFANFLKEVIHLSP